VKEIKIYRYFVPSARLRYHLMYRMYHLFIFFYCPANENNGMRNNSQWSEHLTNFSRREHI